MGTCCIKGPCKLVQMNGTQLAEDSTNPLSNVNSNTFDLDMTIDVSVATEVALELCKGVKEQILLRYDVRDNVMTLEVDDASGVSKYTLSASVMPIDGRLTVHAIFDKSILEVFVNGGEQSFHGFAFPAKGSTGMSLSVSGNAMLDSLTVWEMGTMHK